MQPDTVSFLPLGGIEDVTKNMYVYEYRNQILLVDCGIGFPDEATMPGVDLLLPDISYLLKVTQSINGQPPQKKIVGMVLSHGHEDHIGALPYILPQLPNFPVFGSPLTAGLANEKLKEFGLAHRVKIVPFSNPTVGMGDFNATFIRVTHSVPDTANIFIKTPLVSFYHGSDFKFDITPADGKRSDYQKIAKVGELGPVCLMSDCLGSEREGYTGTETKIKENFAREMKECKGKFIVTTYSSNISRLNQAIEVAQTLNRRVCFVGRSLIKAKEVAQQLGYMTFPKHMEVPLDQIRKQKDSSMLLLVAGSQGQENSAMTRIAGGQHREVRLEKDDTVVFSSDPIPGNEISVNALVNTIAKSGARVLYSDISRGDFHVSGHGSSKELQLLMALVSAKFVLPISGNYKHMAAYKRLAQQVGYKPHEVLLIQNGQRVIFSKDRVGMGEKIPIKTVYVDQISGEEVENFVLRDRQKLVDGGVVIVIAEIDGATGQFITAPDIIARGITAFDSAKIAPIMSRELKKVMSGKVNNWVLARKQIGDTAEKVIFRELRVRPLVLPVVIEG